jgi:Fe-S cluster biosynthesis and repair protein YggX
MGTVDWFYRRTYGRKYPASVQAPSFLSVSKEAWADFQKKKVLTLNWQDEAFSAKENSYVGKIPFNFLTTGASVILTPIAYEADSVLVHVQIRSFFPLLKWYFGYEVYLHGLLSEAFAPK